MTASPTPTRRMALVLEMIAFTIAVPGSVSWWLPRYVFDLWPASLPPWSLRQTAALGPLLTGMCVYLRCVWDFGARGRGIPLPIDHPRALVVAGLYRYVRNPMYLGVLVFLLGEALWLESWEFAGYTGLWLLGVHTFVVFHEEPALTRKFDGSYLHYRASVRRWIPGRRYESA